MPKPFNPVGLTAEKIHHVFTYHSPPADTLAKYVAIREAAKIFALTVYANTPQCADQTTAIRAIREAVMWANASIALDGEV